MHLGSGGVVFAVLGVVDLQSLPIRGDAYTITVLENKNTETLSQSVIPNLVCHTEQSKHIKSSYNWQLAGYLGNCLLKL